MTRSHTSTITLQDDSHFTLLCKCLFYLVGGNLFFYLTKLWASDSYKTRIQRNWFYIWNSHGPATTLVLLFCSGDAWLKYLGGTVLMSLHYAFGLDGLDKVGEWTFKSVFYLLCIDVHHIGAIVALYFQTPQQAWLNALLFGNIWWIHSYKLFADPINYVAKKISGKELAKHYITYTYAASNVLVFGYWCQHLELGANYNSVAIALMLTGRNLANFNITYIGWMKHVETPGIILIASCHLLSGWIRIIPIVSYIGFLKLCTITNVAEKPSPERFIMTNKIRAFLRSLPAQEPHDEKKKLGLVQWWNSNKWSEEFSIFRCILLRDVEGVRKLIEDGVDVNMKHTGWHNSIPLAWAAGGGHIQIAGILIEAGAEPFVEGVHNAAKMFGMNNFIQFYNKLKEHGFEALREENGIFTERQSAPGLTWDGYNELAEKKGGRLFTTKEVASFLKAPIVFDEDQWCAVVGEKGEKDWVQIGDKHHSTGILHIKEFGEPTWGNNLDDRTHGKPTWQRVLLYKLNKNTEESESPKTTADGA